MLNFLECIRRRLRYLFCGVGKQQTGPLGRVVLRGGGFSSGEPRSSESLVSLASRCLPTCRATRINSVGGIGSDDWTFRVVVVGDWVTAGLSAESAAIV